MSDFHNTGKTEDRGQYPRESGPSGLRVELTGFETATPANRRPDHPVTTTSAADQDSLHPVDRLTMSPRQYTEADEAWFGKHANPAGRINLPGAALETSRD